MPFLKNITVITVYNTMVLDQILHIVTQYEMFVCILSQYKIDFNSTKFSAIFFFNKQTKS